MNILITGGSGFIGSALSERLAHQDWQVTILTRNPAKISIPVRVITHWDQIQKGDNFDAVVNLAGEGIANKRWSPARKQLLLDSRLKTTKALVQKLTKLRRKPKVLVNGSAIGYYGIASHDDPVDENGQNDNSFSSELCQAWEAAAQPAADLGIRVCYLRTGIVLDKNGGALNNLLPLFKRGFGGTIGSGKQWMPWIHRADIVGLIEHCLTHDELSGPINATAPHPVTNKAFTAELGNALGKTTYYPMPAFMIKLLMGQMGQELLLAGQNVIPTKALASGYSFQYPTLSAALANIVG